MCNSASVRNLSSIAQICILNLNFPIKHSAQFKPTIAISACMFFTVVISGTASSVLPVITALDVLDSETKIIVFSINNTLPKHIFQR